ncbi:MAG: DNA mismatch repair protein MutL, partial [Paludibacteraceae bacterium]|nr:DNA mismatch repair protein MutL [Paludibacteraceae bacterium]
LQIEGSKFVAQEPVACAVGSSFAVKNLFFNTPARRRFLKSDATEFGHIVTVFNRIALVYPNVGFSLFHNDVEMCNFSPSNQAQRIVDVFGKKLKTQLLPVDIETDVVKINGYVCRPESATKTSANQYFFVNGRFMWHPSFNKAVLQAYDRMLPAGSYPGFYIFLQVDPKTLDVNIHPQKIEVKFENEKTIWSIIQASVREALGKFNVVPDIDFEHADPSVDIPVLKPGADVKKPSTGASSSYNPFADTSVQKRSYRSGAMDWETLYKGFEKQGKTDEATQMKLGIDSFDVEEESVKPMAESSEFVQFRGKYIVTTVKSGLMLIDQHRAHYRVLYDKYMNSFSGSPMASLQMMFPEIVELSPDLAAVYEKVAADLQKMGFVIEPFGKNTYRVMAHPEGMNTDSPASVVKDIVADVAQGGSLDVDAVRRNLALSLSKANAVPYGKQMSHREMNELVSSLFTCSNCNNTPDGKVVIVVLSDSDIDAHF